MKIGFTHFIKENDHFEVIDLDIRSSDQILRSLLREKPAVVVLDYKEHFKLLITVHNCIKEHNLDTKIIIQCDVSEMENISKIQVQQLAISVLSREASTETLQKCLDDSRLGKQFLSKYYTLSRFNTPAQSVAKTALSKKYKHLAEKQLTTKEKEVMRQISGGKSTTEIATDLCLSNRTIDAHRSNILKKLCLKGKTALIHYALEHKGSW